MIAKIKSVFSPPIISGDEELTRQADILNVVAWVALALTLILAPIQWLAGAQLPVILLRAPLVLAEIIVLVLLHRGKVRTASLLLVFSALLFTLIPVFFQGGLVSPYLYFSVAIITLAGLLLGQRYVDLITLVYLAAATLMLLTTDRWPFPELMAPATPLRIWVIVVASLFLVRTLFLTTMNGLSSALERARRNELRLEENNRALERARVELEMRVAERTSDLEQRARQLQVSAEVVSVINVAMTTSMRDLDHLLNEIAHLISERFDFYAVNIFMLETGSSDGAVAGARTADNSANERLVMRAANTLPGKRLIESGFAFSLNQPSIVASAARTRMARLAADVHQDDQYMENPDFPDTRSEAALPLVTGGRLMGVIDVQSAQSVSLTREDLSVLQTLANQVAIAIENAQLFAANQKTLQTLQRAYGNLSREAWQNLLRAQPDRGYRAVSMGDPAPVAEEWQPDMILARDSGKIVIGPTANDAYTLAVPIKIRDQITGVVRLRKPPEAGVWRQEEVGLVVTLSDRLSAALESARLYEETRRRAERERLTGEITAHMRSSNDPQAILQIAARELRKALQADKAQLVVQTTVSPPSTQTDDHPETPAGGQP